MDSGLKGKDWHEAAKAQVQPYLRELLGQDAKVEHVINITSRAPDAMSRYQVKLDSIEVSRKVII